MNVSSFVGQKKEKGRCVIVWAHSLLLSGDTRKENGCLSCVLSCERDSICTISV